MNTRELYQLAGRLWRMRDTRRMDTKTFLLFMRSMPHWAWLAGDRPAHDYQLRKWISSDRQRQFDNRFLPSFEEVA